tara:strand:+ start:2989 stop:3102 length:114 start_codon:yes stop_codon:yes gene_type:complete
MQYNNVPKNTVATHAVLLTKKLEIRKADLERRSNERI